jgi:hypothetical protein
MSKPGCSISWRDVSLKVPEFDPDLAWGRVPESWLECSVLAGMHLLSNSRVQFGPFTVAGRIRKMACRDYVNSQHIPPHE